MKSKSTIFIWSNILFVIHLEIERPENFMGKNKNSTINMLEHMMFNLD